MSKKSASKMKQLIDRAINGDKEAEEKLFKNLLVRFNVITSQRIRDREIAKEIAQNACVAVLEKYRTETFTVGFNEWAWGVLRNTIRNHFRRNYMDKKHLDKYRESMDAEIDSQTEFNPDLEERILECLKKVGSVNKQYARILNLFYQGYTTDEVCRKLRLSKSNCYVLLHRGRAMLKKCLRKGEVK